MFNVGRIATIAAHGLGFAALGVVLIIPLGAEPNSRFFLFQMVVAAYLAASFDLAYSYAKILSFGQGIFFAAGAYAAIYLASSAPWGMPLVILTAVAAAMVLGGLLGAVLVRMGNHSATIATVILGAVGLLAGNALARFTGGEDGLAMNAGTIGIGPLQLSVGANLGMYYVAAIPLVLYFVASWGFRDHRAFKILRGISQNETRAQLLGFNVRLRRFVVFVLAAGVAGVGGAFYALLMSHVTTSVLDLALSVDAILWAAVGGLSTAFGALVGVLVVYPIADAVSSVFTYVQIVVGLLLIVVAVVFPRGIIGTLMEVGRMYSNARQPLKIESDLAGGIKGVARETGRQ